MTVPRPDWFGPLLAAAATPRWRHPLRPPPERGGRASAVLVLLGEQAPGQPDLLVLQRAANMRNHAGQPAFPGGAADPGDATAVDTALREAGEEVGLDPDSVEVLATLPAQWISVSGFVVTPVLAWWHSAHPVAPQQPAEVARVERVPVAELTDPANRLRIRHPSGYVGPAFRVRGMLIWGFTAGLTDAVLTMAGWTRPWAWDTMPVALPVSSDDPVP